MTGSTFAPGLEVIENAKLKAKANEPTIAEIIINDFPKPISSARIPPGAS
jgi:hypothetical protein